MIRSYLTRIASYILSSQRKLVVEHVRYVKQPAISPRAKAHAMAVSMGMTKQADILK